MDLYYIPGSSPCRSVIMLSKAIGVELNLKFLNLDRKEQLKPDYLKLNPQHTVPTLVDNSFSICESRAILIYLVEKYAKDDSLYPKDPKKRAMINQRLYFDMGTLYQSFANYYFTQIFDKTPANPEAEKNIGVALDFLNIFLKSQKYVAGDTLSIADIAILATISSFVACEIDITKYPNIKRWYDHIQTVVPYVEENWEGSLLFKEWLFSNIKQKD